MTVAGLLDQETGFYVIGLGQSGELLGSLGRPVCLTGNVPSVFLLHLQHIWSQLQERVLPETDVSVTSCCFCCLFRPDSHLDSKYLYLQEKKVTEMLFKHL